uniref:Ig-like domain-containing protein n=1 Tax=Oncorhynchus tshawytscha TaxID=74940 RepID=A0AAZ3Q6P0_ONCTS
ISIVLWVYAEVGSNVLLSCNFSSAYNLLWYKQSPGSAPQYLLLIPHSTGTEYRADSLDSRFSGKLNKEKTRVDLKISSAEVTDSAMYYCALRPTVTGNPETLYKNLTSPERVFQLCSSRFCLTIVTSSGVNMHPIYCIKRRNILLHITCNEWNLFNQSVNQAPVEKIVKKWTLEHHSHTDRPNPEVNPCPVSL